MPTAADSLPMLSLWSKFEHISCGAQALTDIDAIHDTEDKDRSNSGLSDKYSLCGLYSVNNAVQSRDFLSVDELSPIVRRLNAAADVQGRDHHGDIKYDGYSTTALPEALRANGYQLRYLNETSTFKCSRSKWFRKVAFSRFGRLIIVDRHATQDDTGDTWHCIARAAVGDKYHFIDSDEFVYKPSTEAGLRHFFTEIPGDYTVKKINRQEKTFFT
ncbi:LOW QUALITY PROTEIN: hypothetical protein PHMEG_0006393 [Phytophthora megakarya]|uniref:Uncharacterized protein n=1 Tax=Phytophthora megakarya TaxID=4795 RepID=A0A225WPX2_9STRA|nr:LOW QUALITY PROTEIN: hypothetical protein PHMEG_0006393 [Phytophthora megakarya]